MGRSRTCASDHEPDAIGRDVQSIGKAVLQEHGVCDEHIERYAGVGGSQNASANSKEFDCQHWTGDEKLVRWVSILSTWTVANEFQYPLGLESTPFREASQWRCFCIDTLRHHPLVVAFVFVACGTRAVEFVSVLYYHLDHAD